MPQGDAGSGAWESDLGGRIGRAVAARRTQLLLTAASLSERTKGLGYPITAATIGRIESNERSGKFEVAELLVLAAALEIPPSLLLFPGFPDGSEQVLPHVSGSSDSAVRWMSGTDGLPGPVDDESDRGLYAMPGVNAGTSLVESVNKVRQRRLEEFSLQIDLDGESHPHRVEELRRNLAQGRQQLEALPAEIENSLTQLWGEGKRPHAE